MKPYPSDVQSHTSKLRPVIVYMYVYAYIYIYIYIHREREILLIGFSEPEKNDEASNRIPPTSHLKGLPKNEF